MSTTPSSTLSHTYVCTLPQLPPTLTPPHTHTPPTPPHTHTPHTPTYRELADCERSLYSHHFVHDKLSMS